MLRKYRTFVHTAGECAHQPELLYREVLVEVIGWSLGSPKVSGRRVLSCIDRPHFGSPTVYVSAGNLNRH